MNRKIALVIAAATLSVPAGIAATGSPAFATTHARTTGVEQSHRESRHDVLRDKSGTSADSAKDSSGHDSSPSDSTSNDPSKDKPGTGSSPDKTPVDVSASRDRSIR